MLRCRVFTAVLFCVLTYAHAVSGQSLTATPTQLNFGTVYENAPDSIQLTLTNTLNRPVQVTGMRFYTTYGLPAFSCSSVSITVPASGTDRKSTRLNSSH